MGASGILGQPRYVPGLKNKARMILLRVKNFQALFLRPDSVVIADWAYFIWIPIRIL